MLKLKLIIGALAIFFSQCSEPVNTADKETQIKQIEETSRKFFLAVYRQDVSELSNYFADEITLKPHHFLTQNAFEGKFSGESGIELKIDKKTHLSNYADLIGDKSTPLTEETILRIYDEIETEIFFYGEEIIIKENVYYKPDFYNNVADLKARKKKAGRVEFRLKKGDAIFKMAGKPPEEDGGSYFQFRYFSDGWKIVAEFQ